SSKNAFARLLLPISPPRAQQKSSFSASKPLTPPQPPKNSQLSSRATPSSSACKMASTTLSKFTPHPASTRSPPSFTSLRPSPLPALSNTSAVAISSSAPKIHPRAASRKSSSARTFLAASPKTSRVNSGPSSSGIARSTRSPLSAKLLTAKFSPAPTPNNSSKGLF